MSTKLGVAIGQLKRVLQICNNTKTLFEGEEIVRKTLKKRKKFLSKTSSFYAYFLFNEQTTNEVKRELRKLNFNYAIRPIFYTGQHLFNILIRSNLLSTSKPRPVISQTACDNCCKSNCICDIRRVIYSIQCNVCSINNCNDKSYIGSHIGKTGRLLKFRINEHKKAVLKEDINNSVMAAHFKLLQANTAASDRNFTANILDKCNGFLDRKILEAYHIINYKPN